MMNLKERIVVALTQLGVTRIGSSEDSCRWSPTDLATDLAPLIVNEARQWKVEHPVAVVQFIPYDKSRRFLALHRSANVRSVPNVWSFPSGLHECGRTIEEQVKVELEEELGLKVDESTSVPFWKPVFTYENVPGDGYHWVMVTGLVRCIDVGSFVNREPDKHDLVELFAAEALHDPKFVERFHPSIQKHLLRDRHRIAKEVWLAGAG